MKALIAATALLVLLAMPAFAAKKSTASKSSAARASYALASAPVARPLDTMNGPDGAIIWGGSMRGKDPDPFIRAGMNRGYGNMGGT